MQLLSTVRESDSYESPVSTVFSNSPEFTVGLVTVAGGNISAPAAFGTPLLNCFDGGTNTGWLISAVLQATGSANLSASLGDGAGILTLQTVSPYQFLGRVLFLGLTVTATRASLYVNGQIAAAADFVTGYTGRNPVGRLGFGGINTGVVGATPPNDWRFLGAAFETSAFTPSQMVAAWEAISQTEQMVKSVDFEGGFTDFEYAWDVPTGLQSITRLPDVTEDVWLARAGGVNLDFVSGGDSVQPLIVYPHPVWA